MFYIINIITTFTHLHKNIFNILNIFYLISYYLSIKHSPINSEYS